MADNDADLADYDDDHQAKNGSKAEPAGASSAKGSYAGIHSSGFKDFLLKTEINKAIADCGYEHPSEVQHECIPQAILGMDIICQAKPGMGKTAVFVISTLHQLDATEEGKEKKISVLVLCNTRELAFQIHTEYLRFSKYLKDVTCSVFYGGIPIAKDIESLKKNPPNIVIGTPGRIKQLVMEGKMDISNVDHFVLDECDQMLADANMRADVQGIFMKTPHAKQVMMFSATLPLEIRPICKKFTQDPLEVYVDDEKLTLHGLQQYYIELTEAEKNRKLTDLLDQLDFKQIIIFTSKVNRATELQRLLTDCQFPTMVIHSSMPQEERQKRIDNFKNFQARILVSTDLMGRGIDVERVNVVINYDMSDGADQYLHRVNRAGRFGTKGLAISFISSPADKEVLEKVQKKFAARIPTMPEKIDPSTYTVA